MFKCYEFGESDNENNEVSLHPGKKRAKYNKKW